MPSTPPSTGPWSCLPLFSHLQEGGSYQRSDQTRALGLAQLSICLLKLSSASGEATCPWSWRLPVSVPTLFVWRVSPLLSLSKWPLTYQGPLVSIGVQGFPCPAHSSLGLGLCAQHRPLLCTLSQGLRSSPRCWSLQICQERKPKDLPGPRNPLDVSLRPGLMAVPLVLGQKGPKHRGQESQAVYQTGYHQEPAPPALLGDLALCPRISQIRKEMPASVLS